MKLHELSPAEGSVKKAWRVGRGTASGNGKTSGRGHKGQKARSGYSRKRGFEGGQLPLARRLPKRGFNNRFAKPLTAVNLSLFNRFADGERIGAVELKGLGLLSKNAHGLKVLSEGTLEKKVVIIADAFSQKAIEKIQAAGGKAEVR